MLQDAVIRGEGAPKKDKDKKEAKATLTKKKEADTEIKDSEEIKKDITPQKRGPRLQKVKPKILN